jgi:hypothetical protein
LPHLAAPPSVGPGAIAASSAWVIGTKDLPYFRFGLPAQAHVGWPVSAQGTQWLLSFILGNLINPIQILNFQNSCKIRLNLDLRQTN